MLYTSKRQFVKRLGETKVAKGVIFFSRKLTNFHLIHSFGVCVGVIYLFILSHVAQTGFKLCVAKDGLEFLILLPPPFKSWDHRHLPSHLASVATRQASYQLSHTSASRIYILSLCYAHLWRKRSKATKQLSTVNHFLNPKSSCGALLELILC